MTGIFTVCRDGPRRNVCTCATFRRCRNCSITAANRARCFSASLPTDAITMTILDNTIRTRRERPSGRGISTTTPMLPSCSRWGECRMCFRQQKHFALLIGISSGGLPGSLHHAKKNVAFSTGKKTLPSDRRISRRCWTPDDSHHHFAVLPHLRITTGGLNFFYSLRSILES